jgi:DNA-binding transcriptional MocR family regulator
MSDAVMKIFPEGTRISQPQGGFVLWVELPEGIDSFALARRALRQNVSIAPGPLFSASGKFGNFVRLSAARVWDARMERALLALAKLI